MNLLTDLKIIILFTIIFYCGIVIIRRVISDDRVQIIFPTGLIFGIALYLFLLNLLAHIIKGAPLFYLTLIFEMALAFFIHRKFVTIPLQFPNNTVKKVWIISLLFWAVFLFVITNTAPINGADNIVYFSHASVFARGDYPIHTPWQPNFISYLHTGISQLLGAVRSMTGAPYLSIHALLAFIFFFSISQILTWFLPIKSPNIKNILIISIPALIGILSLGGFILSWPSTFNLPYNNFLLWLSGLPTLKQSYAGLIHLDVFILFLQRLLPTSIFISAIVILLKPAKNYTCSLIALSVMLCTIALADETILFLAVPSITIIGFFRNLTNLKMWIIFLLITCFIIAIQGGIVTESLLNRYHSGSGVLILPADRDSPYQKFRSFRLEGQSSKYYAASQYSPLNFLQIGIIWQLLGLLLICIAAQYKFGRENNRDLIDLLWILFISSLVSFAIYHVIVPFPFHTNGWRLVASTYQLSGIGIGIFISFWILGNFRKYLPLSLIILWILFFSIVPPFINLFPRRNDVSWFTLQDNALKPSFDWIKKNLNVKDRIIVLTDANPIPSGSIDLATQVGALIPIWPDEYRSYDIFDTNPGYADLYYTLNPGLVKQLQVQYLLIGISYLPNLPSERAKDLENPNYFQVVFSDQATGEYILKILPGYLTEAKNLNGTFTELDQIAPKEGIYYIDHASLTPNINLYRSSVLVLRGREYYGDGDFWNGRVMPEAPFYGTTFNHYNYLVVGKKVNISDICKCEIDLLWTGLGGNLSLLKVKSK